MSDTDRGKLNATDKDILNTLTHGKRETPKNLSAQLNKSADYLSNRSRKLIRQGYCNDPGPADKSGMVEITNTGRVAAHRLDKYLNTHAHTFHDLCQRVAGEQNTNQFDPGHVELTSAERSIARHLRETGGITIASELHDSNEFNLNTDALAAALYTLYFFDIAERKNGMDVYAFTDTENQHINIDS